MRPILNGIFSHMTDRAAFIDRVELSVYGLRRLRSTTSVSLIRDFPIGGPERLYARAVDGVCAVTRNPFQQRYGVMRWPRRVPPVRLIFRSERTPLSCAEVSLVLGSLMRQGFHASLSKAELTFDLTEASVDFFARHILTTARRFRRLRDEHGWETYYVGGPLSPWQARVYQKTAATVRLEFVFRRPFLRKRGIRLPHELVLLRVLDLGRLVQLRELNMAKLQVGDCGLEDYRHRALCHLARRMTLTEFCDALKENRIVRPDLIVPCALESKLRHMQSQLVW